MVENSPKILIIDDEPDVLGILAATVSSVVSGARVFTAPDGPDGIKLAMRERPDVILLDIMMPKMDGFEVCRKLKEDAGTRLSPVIFLTGQTDGENRVKALEAGGEAFLSKPFHGAELTAQIRAMLRVKAANEIRLREEIARAGRTVMLNELASSLAHEINQPLAAILSNAQSALRFLESSNPDLDEARDALKDIVDDNHRISAVIRELRAFLKKDEVKPELLDINNVIEEVAVLVHSDLVFKGISIRKALASGLPGVRVNRVQIQQVILNLIMNGCDAMEETAPADKAFSVSTFAENKESVVVAISDCGTGFHEKAESRMFEQFFTTKPDGLGLGLSTCKSIIETHGGILTVQNNPDKGATVSFTLPAVKGNT